MVKGVVGKSNLEEAASTKSTLEEPLLEEVENVSQTTETRVVIPNKNEQMDFIRKITLEEPLVEKVEIDSRPTKTIEFIPDKNKQMDFMRKVYSLAFAQLLIAEAIVGCVWTDFGPFLLRIIRRNWSTFTNVWFVLYLAIKFLNRIYHKMSFPYKTMMFVVSNLLVAIIPALMAHSHGLIEMIIALSMTNVMVLTVTLYSLQRIVEYTMNRSFLLITILLCITYALVFFFVSDVNGQYLVFVIAAGYGQSCFTIYMTHALSEEKSPEDYVFAAHLIHSRCVGVFGALLLWRLIDITIYGR